MKHTTQQRENALVSKIADPELQAKKRKDYRKAIYKDKLRNKYV